MAALPRPGLRRHAGGSAAQDDRAGAGRPNGWTWLIVSCLARGYLVFTLTLIACALLPMLGGLTGSAVLTGSMAPLIRVGDVVLVQPLAVDAATPLGRVVTFAAPSGTDVVLHRVVAVASNGSLITAGDANAQPDSAHLQRKEVIGLARVLVPWVGLPTLWLHGGPVLPFVIWVVVTAAALAIELIAGQAERRERPRSSRGRVGRAVVASVHLGIVLPVVAGVVAGAAGGGADASFSARTSSIGNAWSVAAAAPAVRLAFRTSPSNSTGGAGFGRQPVVVLQDAQGRTTATDGSVTVSLTTPGGATLRCGTNPLEAVAGVSTFTGCVVDKVGTYTLTARSGGLAAAVSASFVIAPGAASALTFTSSPSATLAGTTLRTTPTVAVVDAGGNTVSSAAAVTLSLTSAHGAVLTCGTSTRSAVAGRVSFSGCRIDLPGFYTLTARAIGLTPAVSTAFVVSGPAVPPLTCTDQTWMATFSWTPTPFAATTYVLYVDGVKVPATGADGWNSYVQLMSSNVPASAFQAGLSTVEVRKIVGGAEVVVGDGTVRLGTASTRTYTCG